MLFRLGDLNTQCVFADSYPEKHVQIAYVEFLFNMYLKASQRAWELIHRPLPGTDSGI